LILTDDKLEGKHTMDGYTFGNRLMTARREVGLTQEQLASRLGVTPQAVSKWERGSGYPDIEMLYYLCDILACTSDYLINRDENRIKLTEDNDKDKAAKLLDKVLAEPLVLEAGNGYLGLLEEEYQNHFPGIHELREAMAETYGILLPVLRIRDNQNISELEYRIIAYDDIIYSCKRGSMQDFTFHDICRQIETTVTDHFDRIFNRQMLQLLLDNVESKYPTVLKGIIPDKIPLSLLQSVLVNLVVRKKSIRKLVKIIEVLEDEIVKSVDCSVLVESVLKRLYV
jgi:flagellar biosynthesis component FlhA